MKVAVAVIFDSEQNILITRRAATTSHGGLWEFPGGKVEPDESLVDALKREIKEEVDLDILQCEYVGDVNHQYADKKVQLLVFIVQQFEGTARCCETQTDLRWVSAEDLHQYEFPEANQQIINLLHQYNFVIEN